MTKRELPSPEILRQLLSYCPDTGALTWRERSLSFFKDGKQSARHNHSAWNGKMAGKRADTSDGKNGYIQTSVLGRNLLGHRIAWAIMTGEWPVEQIDHINGVRADNRWCNLRAVTNFENCRNKRRLNANTSGATGVHFVKEKGRWRASINSEKGKTTHLGYFVSKDAAILARREAEQKFGYHKNHGRPIN